MSTTVLDIQNDLNTYIGDSSTDRISNSDRLQYISEAVMWLQESLKNDHALRTYNLPYLDTVNYYLITDPLPDLLDGADLRRRIGKNYRSMTHKSSRELAEEIAMDIVGDDSWAIERRDDDVYLVINATPQFRATNIDNFDEGVSNWTADMVNSDMSNLRGDVYNFFGGSQSAEFDVIVGQSGNTRATITSVLLNNSLTPHLNLGVFLLDAWIPQQASNVVSYTLYWGTNSSNYWTQTVTTDIDGDVFQNQNWFTLAFDWIGSTQVGTPSASNISYYRIDMNFNGSLTSTVAFHYDSFRVTNPEILTFYYVSWTVGTDNVGNDLYTFGETTDIPFFSGKYDQYRKAVSHKAASICFTNLRLEQESTNEANLAQQALFRVFSIFPSSITKEIKSFSVHGLNFSTRNVGRWRRRQISN